MSTYSAPKWVQNTSSSTAKTTQTRPTRGNFGLVTACNAVARFGPFSRHGALHAVRLCALVQADRGGGRDVETLGAARHRDPHPVRRRVREFSRQAVRLRTEQPRGRP